MNEHKLNPLPQEVSENPTAQIELSGLREESTSNGSSSFNKKRVGMVGKLGMAAALVFSPDSGTGLAREKLVNVGLQPETSALVQQDLTVPKREKAEFVEMIKGIQSPREVLENLRNGTLRVPAGKLISEQGAPEAINWPDDNIVPVSIEKRLERPVRSKSGLGTRRLALDILRAAGAELVFPPSGVTIGRATAHDFEELDKYTANILDSQDIEAIQNVIRIWGLLFGEGEPVRVPKTN